MGSGWFCRLDPRSFQIIQYFRLVMNIRGNGLSVQSILIKWQQFRSVLKIALVILESKRYVPRYLSAAFKVLFSSEYGACEDGK